VRKVREPLHKRLAEDPAALESLAAEVQQLRQQLAAL
jgi:cysteinyl-tRNA synthetase